MYPVEEAREIPPGGVVSTTGGDSWRGWEFLPRSRSFAEELTRSRPTTLSVGSRLVWLPTRLMGQSIFHWLERSGAMSVPITSRLGRRAWRAPTSAPGTCAQNWPVTYHPRPTQPTRLSISARVGAQRRRWPSRCQTTAVTLGGSIRLLPFCRGPLRRRPHLPDPAQGRSRARSGVIAGLSQRPLFWAS
jgi:hypothetical protein